MGRRERTNDEGNREGIKGKAATQERHSAKRRGRDV